MIKGRYSSENDNTFYSILHRYAVVTSLLGYNEKVRSDKIFDDSEKEKYLKVQFSEQRERILLMYADGFISKSAFEWFFGSDADILDVLVSAAKHFDEQSNSENSGDIHVESDDLLEKAMALVVFSRENNIFSDIDYDTAIEIAGYSDITADPQNCGISYSDRLSHVLYRLGEPCAWFSGGKFTNCNFDEYRSELESGSDTSPIYIINLSRLPFILRYMDRLYGVDFIKYASASSLILCRDKNETDAKYEKYLAENKLTFSINAYLRKRKLCSFINCVDYYNYKAADGKIVESSLVPDEKFSCDDKKLSSSSVSHDAEHETSEDELVSKILSEYASGFASIPDDTVVEIRHENRIHLRLFKNNCFSVLHSDFSKPAFDYADVFAFVKYHADRGDIYKKDGRIEFKIDPSDRSPAFLDYARTVLADYLARRSLTGRIAKSLDERKKDAVQFAKENSGGSNNSDTAGANVHM